MNTNAPFQINRHLDYVGRNVHGGFVFKRSDGAKMQYIGYSFIVSVGMARKWAKEVLPPKPKRRNTKELINKIKSDALWKD